MSKSHQYTLFYDLLQDRPHPRPLSVRGEGRTGTMCTVHPGKLVLLIGPSGVGKSVILTSLREKHAEYVFPRSATTRTRRPGEGDTLYHFITEDEFAAWEREGKFLETAQVHKGARYGTLYSEIIPPIEEGKTVIREVDVQGFRSIRDDRHFGPAGEYLLQTIFILPESEEQLIAQIQKRAPMEEEELLRRLESMRKELSAAAETDVQITNARGQLEQTIRKAEEAIEA